MHVGQTTQIKRLRRCYVDLKSSCAVVHSLCKVTRFRLSQSYVLEDEFPHFLCLLSVSFQLVDVVRRFFEENESLFVLFLSEKLICTLFGFLCFLHFLLVSHNWDALLVNVTCGHNFELDDQVFIIKNVGWLANLAVGQLRWHVSSSLVSNA